MNYYTTLQHQQYQDDDENSYREKDDNKVFAKSVKSGYSKNIKEGSPRYNKFYIRIYANKKLYDPFPLYSIGDNKNSFVDKVCRAENSYKQVPENVFNMYLNYLKTENSQWYNHTQRELQNL